MMVHRVTAGRRNLPINQDILASLIRLASCILEVIEGKLFPRIFQKQGVKSSMVEKKPSVVSFPPLM